MQKFHVKKNDEVVVLAGAEKGKRGKIIAVNAKKGRVIVEERPQRRRLRIAQIRVGQQPFRYFRRRVRQLDRAPIGRLIHHRSRPPPFLHRELAQRSASELWVYRHLCHTFRITVSFVPPRISATVVSAS